LQEPGRSSQEKLALVSQATAEPLSGDVRNSWAPF
jgi:hypothetical protein